LDPVYGVGSWIWSNETHDQQYCRLWREFDIPRSATVINARLRITADNTYRLFLDGRELGRGGDWRDLTEYDLTLLLKPGPHVLAVEAFNIANVAGVVAGLRVDFADGGTMEIASDSSWSVVPGPKRGWEKKNRAEANWRAATVLKAVGAYPWNERMVIIKVAQFQPENVQFWQTSWFQITLLSLCAAVLAVCVRLMGKLAIHSQAQQILKRERARIARDIHDDLTAGLTQLVLLGEVAQSELPAGSEPRLRVAKVCEKARSLSRSMNEIIWVVNSQRDTFRDFVSYVCKYAETFLQPTGIRCRFDIEEELPDLPCDLGVRRNLFLAVKEALNNAVRHSGASELILRIHRHEQQIIVAIEDNGKGFDPVLADRERNGLSNMARRAMEAGGVCGIISQAGAGCRVEFTVPLMRSGQHHHFEWPARFWKRLQMPIFQTPPAVSAPRSHSTKPAS
jgi:signal transduction histidine kinase